MTASDFATWTTTRRPPTVTARVRTRYGGSLESDRDDPAVRLAHGIARLRDRIAPGHGRAKQHLVAAPDLQPSGRSSSVPSVSPSGSNHVSAPSGRCSHISAAHV